MAVWKILLTGLDYVPIGEIPAVFDFSLTKPLSGADTCAFRIRYDNPMYDQLDSLECYVKVYRDGVLEFFGPVLTCETTGQSESASAAITCSGPSWMLERVPSLFTGAGSLVDRGQFFATTFLSSLVFFWSTSMVSPPASSESLYVLPLYVPTTTIGKTVIVPYIAPGETKTLQSLLSEISSGLDGFDWRVDYTEPTDRRSDWGMSASKPHYPSIGTFVSAQVIGTAKPDVIFEYGMGQKTLSEFQHISTREDQVTRAYSTYTKTDGSTGATYYPDFSAPPQALDTDEARKWGLLQGDVSLDIPDDATRLLVLKGVFDLRKNPRRRLAITPRGSYPNQANPPAWRTDWNLGDTVGVRIANSDGTMRLNVSVRIYAVQFSLTDNGSEKMTLTVTEQ